ncbi:MAG: 50S ribosomal protein L6 [Armatimonadetes bacterium]|nr:50S ribosomal protein L6 [Armatimonadota bacterium]
MSRIGKAPITVPNGVEIKVDGLAVTVKGPKGQLSHDLPETITLEQQNGTLHVKRQDDERNNRCQHGLQRTLINNMVQGVSEGFEKALEIVGVGYRASMEGPTLVLQIGFSHLVKVPPMEGISFELAQDPQSKNGLILVRGIDKQRVGQQAADIRAIRPPDAYKGKGIRYKGEVIKTKAGKSAIGAKK